MEDSPNFAAMIPSIVGITQAPDPLCLVIERLPSNNLKNFLHCLLKGPVPEWYINHARLNQRNSYREDFIAQDLMNILIQIAEGEVH